MNCLPRADPQDGRCGLRVTALVPYVVAVCFAAITWGALSSESPAQYERHAPPAFATAKDGETPVGSSQLINMSATPGLVEVELTASPARVSMVPGLETDVFAYNGRVPGPLLEVTEGDSVIVRFRNDLSEATTVHWHGLHLPFQHDGSPFHPIGPGEEHTYAFRIHPGTAGTYWYHPHPHHRSAYQVGMGLYGGIIVRDPDDPLPADMTEHLLILSDNRLRADGSIDFPEPNTWQANADEMNGREGDLLFVNDEIMPTLKLRSGEVQRWRVINAAGARIYRLALSGHTFLHIGSDGGLFAEPVKVNEILLAPGERAELLVRGTEPPGTRSVLQTLPYNRYMTRTRPATWNEPRSLLTLKYTDEPPVEPIAVPDTLRRIPVLNPSDATASRIMLMSQGKINSKTMDLNRVDEVASLGATEIWEIENLVGMDHPFHLHGFQFQVLDRNDEPVQQPQWKDTVNVPKFERVRFIVRFEDYRGKWMFHCHILDHEDQGMMGVLQVE